MISKLLQEKIDVIMVHNTSGETAPACSFAEISSYDDTNQHFNIIKPSGDDLPPDRVVILPEEILNNKFGIGYMTQLGVVIKSGAVSQWDRIGTESSAWTGKKISSGSFIAIGVFDTNYILLREVRMGVGAGEVRIAYCKDDAGAGNTIACYLDTDETGEEITVTCNVSPSGSNLNKCIRNLNDGDPIIVTSKDSTWYAMEGFQAFDDAKGLEISGDKLAVKLDATELEFESGGISTKIFECT